VEIKGNTIHKGKWGKGRLRDGIKKVWSERLLSDSRGRKERENITARGKSIG